jgi:outer membrane receptor protein involved in Fe transport
VNILFAEAVIGASRSAPIRGRMTVTSALARMLSRSDLVFRETEDGAFVVAARPRELAKAIAPVAIPEILVVGQRLQNADIRRTQSDVRPYQVYTRREILNSQSETVDSFARTRLPANAQYASPAQDLNVGLGSTRSEVNLRGLGANQTLVLVDGRRMPNLPRGVTSFDQPDLNGIPVGLIERIEVLTATTGGIYGSGATSGVVNIILKRDYRGAEASVTTGITTRGDVPFVRLEGSLGFTPDNGRTNVMLAFGLAENGTLHDRDRDFLRNARQRQFANNPAGFLAGLPTGNGVNVYGQGKLTFDPQFGGGALGSSLTFVPLGLSGDIAERNAQLIANAGHIAVAPPDSDGAVRTVTARPEIRSLIFNARHDFGSGIEGFVDLIHSRNDGSSVSSSLGTTGFRLPADSPNNPFQQPITLAVPLPGYDGWITNRSTTTRITAGLLLPLPGDWRANIEYGRGSARTKVQADFVLTGFEFSQAFEGGTVPNRPALNPLGNWSAFVSALPSYLTGLGIAYDRQNNFSNASLRVGGPILRLPGGPLMVTLLAEQRRENAREAPGTISGNGLTFTELSPRLTRRTRSLYAEAHVPLTDDRRGIISDLEFQLAVRSEWTRTAIPDATRYFGNDFSSFIAADQTTSYTAGLRFRPLPGVTLRASVATGTLPPSTDQIVTSDTENFFPERDPRRGGKMIGSDGPYHRLVGGSPDLRSERARSLSVGAILTPGGKNGPRLSIDFTRIDKRNEIVPFPLGGAGLLAHADDYPGRVVRGPLTQADIARGYTAGPVTLLDLTDINLGKTRIDAVDFQFDYAFDIKRLGRFNVYLRGTWEPHFRQQKDRETGWVERAGFSDGPLEWRGNGGIEWSNRGFWLGVNGQFYSRYRVTRAFDNTDANKDILRFQGAEFIPAQFYLDLAGGYQFEDGRAFPRHTELRLGIVNLLDHRPPIVTEPGSPGYSYYGDPRLRRIELSIRVPFGR